MMYTEFCTISGEFVSYAAYEEKFEPMYMAVDMDKEEFVEFMLPTIKAVAKEERNRREEKAAEELGDIYVYAKSREFVDKYHPTKVNEKTGKITAYLVEKNIGFSVNYIASSGDQSGIFEKDRIKEIERPE